MLKEDCPKSSFSQVRYSETMHQTQIYIGIIINMVSGFYTKKKKSQKSCKWLPLRHWQW